MISHARIRTCFIPGPAGQLEAVLNVGQPHATHAALVCHPHPLFGGTMHNKVAYHAMKALNTLGFPVLRFNFRGAGRSEGEHDHGRGEVGDVRAALAWLEREFPLPVIFAGFSFGAAVGLRAACPDPRVTALISLGTPVHAGERTYTYDFLSDCSKPKLFVSGTRDEFASLSELEPVVGAAAQPRRFVPIEGAGHFFDGQLDALRHAVQEWVREAVHA